MPPGRRCGSPTPWLSVITPRTMFRLRVVTALMITSPSPQLGRNAHTGGTVPSG